MIINRDLNIDQNNRDNHFGHNRAALQHTVMAESVCTPPDVLVFEQNSHTLRFFDEITKPGYFQ